MRSFKSIKKVAFRPMSASHNVSPIISITVKSPHFNLAKEEITNPKKFQNSLNKLSHLAYIIEREKIDSKSKTSRTKIASKTPRNNRSFTRLAQTMRIHKTPRRSSLPRRVESTPNRFPCTLPRVPRLHRQIESTRSNFATSGSIRDFARADQASIASQDYKCRKQPKCRLASLGGFSSRDLRIDPILVSQPTQTAPIPFGFAQRFFSTILFRNPLPQTQTTNSVILTPRFLITIAFSSGRSPRSLCVEFAKTVRSRQNTSFPNSTPVFRSRVNIDPGKRFSMRLPLLSHKVERFTESVIRGMSVEAKKYGAINLAQGMPDFSAPASCSGAAAPIET